MIVAGKFLKHHPVKYFGPAFCKIFAWLKLKLFAKTSQQNYDKEVTVFAHAIC